MFSEPQCVKRSYRGPRSAKKAHLDASFRIRVYLCSKCKRYHVTNNDKLDSRWGF